MDNKPLARKFWPVTLVPGGQDERSYNCNMYVAVHVFLHSSQIHTYVTEYIEREGEPSVPDLLRDPFLASSSSRPPLLTFWTSFSTLDCFSFWSSRWKWKRPMDVACGRGRTEATSTTARALVTAGNKRDREHRCSPGGLGAGFFLGRSGVI